jgi:hypothetical protein
MASMERIKLKFAYLVEPVPVLVEVLVLAGAVVSVVAFAVFPASAVQGTLDSSANAFAPIKVTIATIINLLIAFIYISPLSY